MANQGNRHIEEGRTPMKNNVRRIRERLLMSKAELARRAGVSALTIDRVEKGMPCRVDTMRKILFGLGLSLDDQDKVFGEMLSHNADSEDMSDLPISEKLKLRNK